MDSNAWSHLIEWTQEHRPQTFVAIKVWKSILQDISRFCYVHWMQNQAGYCSCYEIPHKTILFEDIGAKVKLIGGVITDELIAEDMSNS